MSLLASRPKEGGRERSATGMRARSSLLASFAAGAGGGCLLTAAILGVVAASGGLGSSNKTVTVQQTLASPVSAPGGGRALSPRSVYERDAPGVVFISAAGVSQARSPGEFLKGEGGEQGTATGSGFEIDANGTILTNWHVIAGASKITVGLEHGRTVEASVIGKDPSDDIALLRIPIAGLVLHPLILGDSSRARVGDPVLAIGNPFGLARTLTTGIVSALERQIQAPNGVTIDNVLQTDAPINPGNSGGPLLNQTGEAIGINSQIETGAEHGGSVGIAFAIPIDAAKHVLAALAKD
jgi:S1-C subfamily serine protease